MFKFSIVDLLLFYSLNIVTFSQTNPTTNPTNNPSISPTTSPSKSNGDILGMPPVLFFIILAIIVLSIFGIILYIFMKQKNKSNSNESNDPNKEKVELSNNKNKNNTNSNKLNSNIPNDPHNPDANIRRNSFRKFKSMEEAEKHGKTTVAPSLKLQDEEVKPKYRKKRSRTLSETLSRIFNIQITTPRGTDYSTGEYNKRRTSSNLDNNNNNNDNDNHHEELEQIQENNEEEVDDIDMTPVTYNVNNNDNQIENGNQHTRVTSEEEIENAYEQYQKRRSLHEDEDDSDD